MHRYPQWYPQRYLHRYFHLGLYVVVGHIAGKTSDQPPSQPQGHFRSENKVAAGVEVDCCSTPAAVVSLLHPCSTLVYLHGMNSMKLEILLYFIS